ncbi:hypothetical protein [Streptomyces sp. NBC_01092]|uniref:hypothetical protein n=1 Tax=Streptomyces sp. NBC_01092 TaxID=2903748 RepID=UPI00386CCFD6|nr:hypothetical protein OG254_15340 [Streptomyces sp. NBC_01092]
MQFPRAPEVGILTPTPHALRTRFSEAGCRLAHLPSHPDSRRPPVQLRGRSPAQP